MSQKLVKQVMHHGVIGCQADTPVSEVVRILSDTDIHALVVTGEAGEVVGIISHMDVIPLHGQDLSRYTASDIMTKKVISVSPDTPMSDAVKIMIDKRIHRLVVTEPQEDKLMPVGVLSTTDVVREMRGAKWTWYL
ncbi:MAG: CBS domain-containing protein [Caldilineales bacterium]|nr:CBS domain-containing protein [Caldilineales bacterium]MDW8318731.1 CBS domain-containing protein [Anaerolineae bacterium]